ncbi:MAG: S-adenosyl-l-methionine hydroxide adenosyltransferase family protein [Bdellovibrionales bacterium]|nr:S-adenosyl-l-methionine hydroxide adenosyltransferase family protein [Bdellovibrionales bacterium]
MRALVLTLILLGGCATSVTKNSPTNPLVLTTDFGVKDGAVSAMKGVAYGVSKNLVVSDLTHEIPPYDLWQAAYRLQQTYKYWPVGTVFVTVVDPGVGSARRSLVVRSKSGHVFVGPDNGHLTLVLEEAGLEAARVLDENLMRRKGSEESYTFHGRDLYSFVGARLASGDLRFENSGRELTDLVRLPYQKAQAEGGKVAGMIPVLDSNYGNVWTNIPKGMIMAEFSGAKELNLRILHKGKLVYSKKLPLVDTFAAVAIGKPLLYFNSLLNLSVALNQGDFARQHKIASGIDWTVVVSR